MEEPPNTHTEESSEEYEGYYHYHMRMTAEICLTVNTDLVNSNAFNDPTYEQMPEDTRHAYQQLFTSMLADPRTKRRLLATMLLEKAWELYYNEEDILEDLAPAENLVTDEAKRVGLEDLVKAHLVPGAPYYWWKDAGANERTFQESEAEGGLDTEPLHATIDDQLCDLRFEEVDADNCPL